MNNLKRIALCLVLLLCLPQRAAAETACRIQADSVNTLAGQTLQIPFRIYGNPGFTNFGIGVRYDKSAMTMVSIQNTSEETTCLSSALVGINTDWEYDQGNSQGYITAAASGKIEGDGILFVATFEVDQNFVGETAITPYVCYLHCYNGESGFTELDVTAEAGKITGIIKGDIDMDRIIEYNDVMLVYDHLQGTELTEQQVRIGDMDGNGLIDEKDIDALYNIYTGGN